jgi:ParB family chromosome partitioning protein
MCPSKEQEANMARAARYAQQSTSRVLSIPVGAIAPNPNQPRRAFDEASLSALAASIRQMGLLQPIAVRAVDIARYELIAGERRLRACRLLGLTHIDALLVEANPAQSALLALVENLQREDLHYFDEAEGYAAVLRECPMTQEALAARIGRTQGAIANKLRLLKLEPAVRAALRAEDLSERHARALLRLPLAAQQLEAARRMAEGKLSAKQGDALINQMLAAAPPEKKARRVLTLIRDHRLYLNALRDIVRQMQAAGYPASTEVREREGQVEVLIRFPSSGG